MVIDIEQIRPELTWRLRQQVLYPNKKLFEMELDEDELGWHFGVFHGDNLIGVASLFKRADSFQFRKLAIAPHLQGKGIGTMLLHYLINFAITEGAETIWCNARHTAIDFYLKAGFVKTGETFTKNNLDYVIMQKTLTGQ